MGRCGLDRQSLRQGSALTKGADPRKAFESPVVNDLWMAEMAFIAEGIFAVAEGNFRHQRLAVQNAEVDWDAIVDGFGNGTGSSPAVSTRRSACRDK